MVGGALQALERRGLLPGGVKGTVAVQAHGGLPAIDVPHITCLRDQSWHWGSSRTLPATRLGKVPACSPPSPDAQGPHSWPSCSSHACTRFDGSLIIVHAECYSINNACLAHACDQRVCCRHVPGLCAVPCSPHNCTGAAGTHVRRTQQEGGVQVGHGVRSGPCSSMPTVHAAPGARACTICGKLAASSAYAAAASSCTQVGLGPWAALASVWGLPARASAAKRAALVPWGAAARARGATAPAQLQPTRVVHPRYHSFGGRHWPKQGH